MDKYVLIEKSFESEIDSQRKDDEGAMEINASNIQYENIEVLLGGKMRYLNYLQFFFPFMQ